MKKISLVWTCIVLVSMSSFAQQVKPNTKPEKAQPLIIKDNEKVKPSQELKINENTVESSQGPLQQTKLTPQKTTPRTPLQKATLSHAPIKQATVKQRRK